MGKRTIDEVEPSDAEFFRRRSYKRDRRYDDRRYDDRRYDDRRYDDRRYDDRRYDREADAMDIDGGTGEELMGARDRRDRRHRWDRERRVGYEEHNDHAMELDTPEPERNLPRDERYAFKPAERHFKGVGPSPSLVTTSPSSDPASVATNLASASVSSSASPNGPPTTTRSYTESRDLTILPRSDINEYLTQHSINIVDPYHCNFRPITSFWYLPPHEFDFSAYTAPTPIQAATWPFTLAGYDCIGIAETGSGKTLAFSVPAIRLIANLRGGDRKCIRAVVVSPTRELAMQIYESMKELAKSAELNVVCVHGGVSRDDQKHKVKWAQIVVATPGRLNDLIDDKAVDLSRVSYLVLDEADRMLDNGFEQDVRRIVSAIPNNRQTLMFTATWPSSVRTLASTFMRNPVKITIGGRDDLRANVRIQQIVEVLDPRDKEQRLLALIRQHQSGAQRNDRILVFCLYKKEAMRVENFLQSQGCRVTGIHGDLSQAQRTQALAEFKDGKCPLLVATDVAARGLDIPDVKLVINVTFPLTIEDYVHRIGRTGRAGAEGTAHTFFTEEEKALSGSLVNVLKAAGQPVPEALLKFGTTVKKKEHEAYGSFYRDTEGAKAATRIKFND